MLFTKKPIGILIRAMAEIKLVMAAVYTNFTTSIIDDEGIEQEHSFISLPMGRKLMLKFSPASGV